MVLELIGIQQIGSKNLTYNGVATQCALCGLICEVALQLVNVDIHLDATRLLRLWQALVQCAKVCKAEVVEASARSAHHLLDRECAWQQQLHDTCDANRRGVECTYDGVCNLGLLSSKYTTDNNTTIEDYLVSIDATCNECVVERYRLSVNIRAEGDVALRCARNDRICRANALLEYYLTLNLAVHIQLVLGKGCSLNFNLTLLHLNAVAINRSLNNGVTLEDDIAVELRNLLWQDRSSNKIILEENLCLVNTYFFKLFHILVIV